MLSLGVILILAVILSLVLVTLGWKRLKKSIQKTNSVFWVHFTVAPNLRQRIRLPDTYQIGFFSIGILSSIFGRDVSSRWMRLLLMFWCMKLVTISDFPMRICG